ncbi:MAG: nicotinate (nicotinamide) nucleotide adenylyltransferase [Oligoflexia bacterium]|nr:nicotinate (nicotinamide) nucleotide adenylyltransferase [Oligoflexia bacterium]
MKASQPRWADVTAVFGGRFDPPHQGHLEAVRGLFANPGVRRVLVLPSPTPPHKPAAASAEQRLAMTRLTFQPSLDNRLPAEVQIDLREFERSHAKPSQPTYSFDTLSEMRREYGETLAFVIGTDQLENLSKWHRFPEILGLCHWIVLERKDSNAAKGLKTLSEWEASGLAARGPASSWSLKPAFGMPKTSLILIPTPARAISSTAIREALALKGEVPENQLPAAVYAYLKNGGVYGITRRD